MKNIFVIIFILLLSNTYAQTKDLRYCGVIKRDFNGEIVRDQALLVEFQKLYPCPHNNKKTGQCPGWYKDHIIPLACGGCDSIENLQWLPQEIKTCKEDYCKDRFERKIYSVYEKNKYCK